MIVVGLCYDIINKLFFKGDTKEVSKKKKIHLVNQVGVRV